MFALTFGVGVAVTVGLGVGVGVGVGDGVFAMFAIFAFTFVLKFVSILALKFASELSTLRLAFKFVAIELKFVLMLIF